MIYAQITNLDEWAAGRKRSRWDYSTDDHLIEEILKQGETYFSRCCRSLRQGDIIHVTDAAQNRVTFLVDTVDSEARKVALSIDIEHAAQPVVPHGEAFTVRWRGPRGGLFCILDDKGEIYERDIATKVEAERKVANLLEGSKAA